MYPVNLPETSNPFWPTVGELLHNTLDGATSLPAELMNKRLDVSGFALHITNLFSGTIEQWQGSVDLLVPLGSPQQEHCPSLLPFNRQKNGFENGVFLFETFTPPVLFQLATI